MKQWDSTIQLTVFSHILTWAGFLWLVFWPSHSKESVTLTGEGLVGEIIRHKETLIDANGAWVILLLLAPVVLTGTVVLALMLTSPESVRRKVALWGGSIVLIAACLVSIASIGIFYIPAALILMLATMLTHSRNQPGLTKAR